MFRSFSSKLAWGFILAGLVLPSSFAMGAKENSSPVATFQADMKDQLANLAKEMDRLSAKEKSIPSEQKAAFSKDMTDMKTKWQSLSDAISHIKTHISTNQKSHISTRVSALEHDLDQAENSYGDKHLGLGELLGF